MCVALATAFMSLAPLGERIARAAWIGAEPAVGQSVNIVILGKIESDDDERFRKIIVSELQKGHWIGLVRTYSPGGDTTAAMRIGEQIRTLRASTVAPSRMDSPAGLRVCLTSVISQGSMQYSELDGTGDPRCECASACFLIWAAGEGREGDVLGLHRMRFTDPMFAGVPTDTARLLYERAIQEGMGYLRKMGIPENIIQLNFGTSSGNLRYLSKQEVQPMLGLSPGIEELKLARCGRQPGNNSNDSARLRYFNCTQAIYEEDSRKGGQEFLRVYGDSAFVSPGLGGPYIPVPSSPEPGMPATRIPDTAQKKSSFWNHNGSLMYLVADGATRRFYYERPRDGIGQVGVQYGTLLFEGRKDGNTYSGTAFIFSSACGATPYQVSGTVSADDQQVTLYGQAPRLNDNCQIVGYREDKLVFTFRQSAAR